MAARIKNGRLTPEEVVDVFLSTDSTTRCGQRLNVSGAAVSFIRNRKTWRELTKHLVRPFTPVTEH